MMRRMILCLACAVLARAAAAAPFVCVVIIDADDSISFRWIFGDRGLVSGL